MHLWHICRPANHAECFNSVLSNQKRFIFFPGASYFPYLQPLIGSLDSIDMQKNPKPFCNLFELIKLQSSAHSPYKTKSQLHKIESCNGREKLRKLPSSPIQQGHGFQSQSHVRKGVIILKTCVSYLFWTNILCHHNIYIVKLLYILNSTITYINWTLFKSH